MVDEFTANNSSLVVRSEREKAVNFFFVELIHSQEMLNLVDTIEASIKSPTTGGRLRLKFLKSFTIN